MVGRGSVLVFGPYIICATGGLLGLVARVPGYRSRYPGFDSRRYQIFRAVVGLERGLFSLVSVTEEVFERKSSGSGSRKPRILPWGSFFFLLRRGKKA
jgi:hypothetical protein